MSISTDKRRRHWSHFSAASYFCKTIQANAFGQASSNTAIGRGGEGVGGWVRDLWALP